MQQQCFLKKQNLVQAQNQHFCNDTLARLLSCAENYAAKFNPNIIKQYEYYDPFNSSNKNILDLKIQFMLQINLFVISFQDFNEEYNEYIFPENKTKEEIINELMEWQEIVDDEDKDFYETLIDLLNGKNVKLYMDEIDKIVKNSPEDANPKIFIDTIPGLRYDHDMRKKKTKQEFMKNGKYSENFQLNKKPENNPIYEQIKKNRENQYQMNIDKENCLHKCNDDGFKTYQFNFNGVSYIATHSKKDKNFVDLISPYPIEKYGYIDAINNQGILVITPNNEKLFFQENK